MNFFRILLIFFAQNIYCYSQITKLPNDSLNNKITYSKYFYSKYSNKLIYEKKWISEEFHVSFFDIKEKDNTISFISSIPIYKNKNDLNSFIGEVSFCIKLESASMWYSIYINDLYFVSPNTKDTIPLEKISVENDILDIYKKNLVISQASQELKSFIKSFENYINPFYEDQSESAILPDIIVLIGGTDTIKCEIVEETIQYIIFKKNLLKNDTTSEKINQNMIEYYIKQPQKFSANNFDLLDQRILSKKENEKALENDTILQVLKFPRKLKYQKCRLVADFGISYRTAKLSSNIDESLNSYIDKLRIGYGISSNLSYFFRDNMGIGMNFTSANSHSMVDDVVITQGTNIVSHGRLEESINIKCIAPSFITRSMYKNSNVIVNSCFMFGYMTYSENMFLIDMSHTITGNTFFLGFSCGLDGKLNNSIALGFSISYIYGYLTEILYDNRTIQMQKNEYEGLTKFELNFGLRGYF